MITLVSLGQRSIRRYNRNRNNKDNNNGQAKVGVLAVGPVTPCLDLIYKGIQDGLTE